MTEEVRPLEAELVCQRDGVLRQRGDRVRVITLAVGRLVLSPIVVGDHAIATSGQDRADLGEILLASRVAMDQEGIAASLVGFVQLDCQRLTLDPDGSHHPLSFSRWP